MKKNFYVLASLLILLFAVISINVSAQELKRKQDSNGKYGFVDESGKFVIKSIYDDVKNFSEDLAAIKLSGKWGFIDKSGNIIIKPKYGYAWRFSEGFASVELNRKCGFINRSGEVVIELKYDGVDDFFENLAAVRLNGKWGLIDIVDNIIIPITCNYMLISSKESKEYKTAQGIVAEKYADGEYDGINRVIGYNKISPKFSYYAQMYVQQNINKWQKKGEFEKTLDWQKRVNQESRELKAINLTKEAENKYIAIEGKSMSYRSLVLGTYDADNEVFLFEHDRLGKLLIPVSIDKAKTFKANWRRYTIAPRYFIENDQLGLAELTFTSKTNSQEQYKYSNSASLNYAVANVTYNFDPIELDLAGATGASATGVQNFVSKTLTVGKSDVDMDIPVTNVVNKNTFAVIISNENYRKVAPVAMSINDGKVFKEYCHKTLGLPENNVRFYKDATYGDLLGAVRDIKQISEAYNGAIDVIFYYSGHGFPHETTHDAYLLPVDGSSSQVEISYPLSRLYSELNLMKAQHVTIFIDACFSGSQRDGAMLASARGIAIKPKMASPLNENMVVFSAASGDETAFPYKTKNHGIFTYYLLKKLKETKGEVTLGELGDYIITNVKRSSVVENKKLQTPTVSTASARYLVPTK